jgi:hypothetical protein
MRDSTFLWPILAIWMGLAFLVLFSIIGFLAWGAVHIVRDAFGVKDTIWCPALKRELHVRAVPRHFYSAGGQRFADLQQCERFGEDEIACAKACLKVEEKAAAFAV